MSDTTAALVEFVAKVMATPMLFIGAWMVFVRLSE